MGFRAIKAVFDRRKNPRLSSGELSVLLAIARYAGQKGDDLAWPSISTIAADTGLSERHVKRHVARLVKCGELQLEKRTGTRSPAKRRVMSVNTPTLRVYDGPTLPDAARDADIKTDEGRRRLLRLAKTRNLVWDVIARSQGIGLANFCRNRALKDLDEAEIVSTLAWLVSTRRVGGNQAGTKLYAVAATKAEAEAQAARLEGKSGPC